LKNPTFEYPSPKQAVVISNVAADGTLLGQAGPAKFLIGGPDGHGGTSPGPNPYDLLSASLAACTAATVRLYASHKRLPLSNMEVSVSYHRGTNNGSDGTSSFERVIKLEGDLSDLQREQLMKIADVCPVGRLLGLNAKIHTRPDGAKTMASGGAPASYDDDLGELSIPYIDPD
jgi:putative redox protein